MIGSNHERYMTLAKHGRITAAEAKELIKAFPIKEIGDEGDDEDKIIRIVSNFELEDKEDELMREGYRHRQIGATVHEFRRKGDNSFRRFIVDPWLR